MGCHKRKYIPKLGKIKKKKRGEKEKGGDNGWLWRFEHGAGGHSGWSDVCCGMLGVEAPATGLVAGSARRAPPSLSTLRGTSGGIGDTG